MELAATASTADGSYPTGWRPGAGVEVLPAGVLPLTAVPTVLERGEPVCRVTFTDGHTEEHDLGAVAEFVTEEHNPGNRLGVQRVVVRLDAAILVTSADPPISRGERAFLGRVAEQAVRLFVVLNKADYLSGEELRRTVEFTGRVVGEVVPAWPGPVYPLSARPGVGDPAGLARFAKDLRRFLERERAAAVADAATQSGRRALGLLALALDLERREAERPALLERLAGPLLDRAEAAALAAYANAIGPVVDRAGARLAQLHQEAASAFEVCLPAFTPPEVDTTVGSVGVATPRVTHLADELVAAAWRLRGRRGARERAVTRARAAAASDADALVGRLRGATSMTLGEASRRLAGQLRRHQRELAGSLRAAVDRGGALLEAAERDRTNRQATLDQVAALLQQAEAALSPVDQDGPGS